MLGSNRSDSLVMQGYRSDATVAVLEVQPDTHKYRVHDRVPRVASGGFY